MKKIILGFFGLTIHFSSIHAQSINDSLLIYYPFEGNFNDYSGNGYHGSGTATFTTDSVGNVNAAGSFNGINQYIDMPNISALKPGFPFSFSFWIKPDTITAETGTLFTTSFNTDTHSGSWMNWSSTGYMVLSVGNGGSPSSTTRNSRLSADMVKKDAWQHIVGIARSETDMDIWMDCNLSNDVYSGNSSITLTYTSGAGSIGRKDANTSLPEYYFKGAMDEFRYWNREITATEIAYLCELHLISVNDQIQKPYEELSAYPNPTNNTLTFESLAGLDYKTIEVLNTNGEIVMSQTYDKTISIAKLAPGLYVANLTCSKGNYQVRFLKD